MPRTVALRHLAYRFSLERQVSKLPAFAPTLLLARVLLKARSGDPDALRALAGGALDAQASGAVHRKLLTKNIQLKLEEEGVQLPDFRTRRQVLHPRVKLFLTDALAKTRKLFSLARRQGHGCTTREWHPSLFRLPRLHRHYVIVLVQRQRQPVVRR